MHFLRNYDRLGGVCSISKGAFTTITGFSFIETQSGIDGAATISNYSGTVTVTNSIILGNTLSYGHIYILEGGTSTVTYCELYQDGYEGIDGNIRENPLFRDPDGPDDITGTMDDSLHLQSDSQCINAGSNEAPGLPTTDKEG